MSCLIMYTSHCCHAKQRLILQASLLFVVFFLISFFQISHAHDFHGTSRDDAYWAKLAQEYPSYPIPGTASFKSLEYSKQRYSEQKRFKQASSPATDGRWSEVITWPHVAVSAANLPDGRILTFSSWGRDRFFANWQGVEYTHVAIWNPDTGEIIENDHTSRDLFAAHLVMLEDGRLILTGGNNRTPFTTFYDFKTDQWSKTEDMNRGRWYPTSLAMPNGSVFTALGTGGGRYPELWTKEAGWKLLTGIDLQPAILDFNHYEREWWPYFYVDPRGKIFHAGPTPKMHSINPEGVGSITQIGPEIHDWYPKHGVTVMYEKGKILVAGGAISGNNLKSTNKAMIIDINGSSPIVTPIDSMKYARKFHNGVILPTGEVLVVGGNTSGIKFNDAGTILPSEIWNPKTKKWRTVASISVPRNYHSVALLMADGRVFSSGSGLCGKCTANHLNTQIYSPPYLFDENGDLAERPVINNAPDSIKHGQSLTLNSDNDISRFTLIKMSATTHAINTDLRFIEVPYNSAGNGVYTLTFPANKNVLTPGYWMLFAINSKGVPSKSKIIQIKTQGTPVISQPQNQYNLLGSAISLKIEASDPKGEMLFFSASNLPRGLSIDSHTGMISGTVNFKETKLVTITVSNGNTKSEASFEWQIYPSGNIAGVSYELYTSKGVAWNQLPDFATLTSDENGVLNNISLPATIPSHINDYYALRFSSKLLINTAGDYTFFLKSINGSKLWIDDTLVIDNDGIHDVQEKRETVFLEKGEHRLVVAYFNNDSNGLLTLQYQGHLFTKRNIPDGGLLQNPLINVPPQILSQIQPQTFNVNMNVDLPIIAADANNDPLHYSAAGLPLGLQINPSTGRITGKPSVIGEFNSTITVSDNHNLTRTLDIEWTVAGPLTIEPFNIRPRRTSYTHHYVAHTNGGINNQYQWDFGDGSASTGFSSSPSITHQFTDPGRFIVTLTVKTKDANGNEQYVNHQFIQPVYNREVSKTDHPSTSMSIVYDQDSSNIDRIWNVNPDNDTVSVFNALQYSKLAEIAVGKQPRSLVKNLQTGNVWVANKDSASISIIGSDSLQVIDEITLPRASQPYGVVVSPTDHFAYVTLEATGKLLQIDTQTKKITKTLDIGSNPRHLSITTKGDKIYVSRYITPLLPGENTLNVKTEINGQYYGGELLVIDVESFTISNTIILKHGEQPDSARSARGIPNYLGTVALSPDGLTAWIPSKQDNIKRGGFRDGNPLTYDTVVRSVTSRIDLVNGVEQTLKRVDHDNAGIPSAATFGRYGNLLFVALEGSQEIEVVDAYASEPIFRFESGGHAPQGLVVSADGLKLYVHNYMERTIAVFNLEDLVLEGKSHVQLLATLHLVNNEKLPQDIFKGKQLFYDSKDSRLAAERYSSCAQCHNEGRTDGRVWDSSNFGEGLRNTISLVGHGEKNGLLHWSGNFDEVHDFEVQIRTLSGGEGLLSDADFEATKDTLGPKKEGLSVDMDNLAKYVKSLNKTPDSPYKNADGSLTADAKKGEQLFLQKGCDDCHSGPFFTDSARDNLHNIGTMYEGSGKRLGGELKGFNTPTLLGLWMTAPYLHDGSAATLQDAIKVMRNKANHEIRTTAHERDLLAAYLMQIDSKTKQPKTDDGDTGGGNSNGGGSIGLEQLLILLFLLVLINKRQRIWCYQKV